MRETRVLLLGWTLVYGFGSWLLEYMYGSVGAARPMSVAAGSKNVIYAVVWAPLLVAAVALTDRWPIRSATDWSRLLLHGIAIVAAPFAWGTAAYYLCLTFVPEWAPWGVWRTYLKTANGVLYVYVVVVGICHVAHWIRANRTREVAALRAAEAATRAQLQVLSLELQPHFLLNALNAVSALIYDDGDRAVEALRGLRAMLDQSVRSAGVAEVALTEEVASLATYTRVQELRFGDRLALTWRIAPGVEHAALPPFLLQPLVENAIKFSVEALPGRHAVAVEATRTGGDLVLRVSDDGVGVQTARGAPPRGAPSRGAPSRGFGHGLRNARERLRQTYGDRHRLTLTAGPSGRGTVVEVRIPFHVTDGARMKLTRLEVAPHAVGAAPAASA